MQLERLCGYSKPLTQTFTQTKLSLSEQTYL